ncbi:MAG: 23S rRNA (uracil(1939)-C(5))-methyltransferase RlmD [Solirubrobacteraceae bacterium]
MTTTPQARPARGDELELTVDSLAHGGNGVARRDGYVVFVAGAVPGDRVRAVVGRAKRAYAEARAVEVLDPSPDRIPAAAEHPGAAWQVLPYERQLEVKAGLVGEALERIGRLEGFELEPIVPAVEQWRYRNKLEYSFGTGAGGELVCGFHAPGRWDEIVSMEDCLLASERSNAVREQVLAWCRAQGLTAWDRREQHGLLRNLVIREGRRTGELQVRLVTSPGRIDADSLVGAVACDGLFWTQQEQLGESTLGGETVLLSGTPQLRERLGGLDFLVSPEAFFQTNTEMAERLYGIAAELAGLRGTERVFDLYCGIGTIALMLAARAREVVGVEIVEAAVADAIENARLNDVLNARFYAGDIRLAMRDLVEQAGRPDVAVVDPPRSGLSQKVVRRILEARPSRVVYVSCNPTTLAPNAAQMVEAGYRLVRVRPVDMFPQTPHIECVALLERG